MKAPEPPGELAAVVIDHPSRQAIVLEWRAVDRRKQDGVEIQRHVGQDWSTLAVIDDGGFFIDLTAPVGECRYRARKIRGVRNSGWSAIAASEVV